MEWGAGHVVAASTRVIYGKLCILLYFMTWPGRFGRWLNCGHALAPELVLPSFCMARLQRVLNLASSYSTLYSPVMLLIYMYWFSCEILNRVYLHLQNLNNRPSQPALILQPYVV
jgi:hypothetical protein